MPHHQRELRIGELTVADVEIGSADAARADSDPDLAPAERPLAQLRRAERRSGLGEDLGADSPIVDSSR
jgi:hypothetical protein